MLKVLFPWKQNNTKKVLISMEQQVVKVKEVTDVTEELPEHLPLLPCHVCNRTFLPQPLKKHIRICEQMAHKKRKPFDSLKQRIEGTDLAPFFQKSYLKKKTPDMSHAQAADAYGSKKQSKWKDKHLELVNSIRSAKGTSPEMSFHSTTTATPNRKLNYLAVSQTSLNERCPSCDRAFGPKAFDRHVEWCQERKTRVHKSPANVQQAKERLDARIKYRVPPLKQPKRITIRAKYSPTNQANKLFHRSNSMLTGKSTSSIGCNSTVNVISTRRKNLNNSEKEINHGNRQPDSRTRFDKGIGDCAEMKEKETCDSTVSKSFHTKRTIPIKKINNSTINNGLQEITVSSLRFPKNKKLLTWKGTTKIPPNNLEVLSKQTNRNHEEKSSIDLCNTNSKAPEDVKKRNSVEAVANTVFKEKLTLFHIKKQANNRKLLENELTPSRVHDEITVDSSEEKNFARFESIEKISDFDELYGVSSSPTVNTSDFEGDVESFRCHREINKRSEIMVGSDMESTMSLHGSANTETYTYDENETKNVVVAQGKFNKLRRSGELTSLPDHLSDKGSNYIRKNGNDKEKYEDIHEKPKTKLTVDPTDYVNNSSSARSFARNLKVEKRHTSSTVQYVRLCSIMDSKISCAGDAQLHEDNVDLNLKQKELFLDLESKNNDLNIDLNPEILSDQEFSKLMSMHRLKKTEVKEGLELLEQNRIYGSVSEDTGKLYRESLVSQCEIIPGENEILEERAVKEWKTKVFGRISSKKLSNEGAQQEINLDDNSYPISNKKTLFKKISKKNRIWKRRQKTKKCRMCIECLIRNNRSRRVSRFSSKVKNDGSYCDSLDSTEEYTESLDGSSIDDKSLSMCESKDTLITKLSTIPTAINITIRRSRSVNENVGENSENVSLKSGKTSNMNKSSRIYDKTSQSLPNISILRKSTSEVTVEERIKENEKLSMIDDNLIPEDSVDSVVPKKRRKICGSPPKSLSKNNVGIEREVENLKTNITKIKYRKHKEDEPPVILDYEKIPISSESNADILYLNRVFSCLISPERSELESGNEHQADGVQDEIKNWNADEEQTSKDCVSGYALPKITRKPGEIKSGVDISRSRSVNCTQPTLCHLERRNSNKTLKNSSACLKANEVESFPKNFEEDISPYLELDTEGCQVDVINRLKNSDEINGNLENNSSRNEKYKISSKDIDTSACRLPKIATLEKQEQQLNQNDRAIADMKLPVIIDRTSQLSNNIYCVAENSVDETSIAPSSVFSPEKVSICQQTSRQKMGIDKMSIHSNEFRSNSLDAYSRKTLSSAISSSTSPYDPFELAQRQFMELLDHDDEVSVRSSPLTLKIPDISDNFKTQNNRPHTTLNATPQLKVTRASVIDPPYNFQDKINSLDEDFELIESLVNNNILRDLTQNKDEFLVNLENLRCNSDDYSNSLQLKCADVSSIDPNLINEHDNLSIPENLLQDEYSQVSSTDSELTIQNFDHFINFFDDSTTSKGSTGTPAELKVLTECIQPSTKFDNIRPAPDGSSGEAETTENHLNLKSSPNLSKLSRTDNKFKIHSSAGSEKKKDIKRSTVTSSDTSATTKTRDAKMCFREKQQHEKMSTNVDSDLNEEILRAEELFAVDDKLYEEYKKYEETYLKEKSKKHNTKKQKKNQKTADFGIILEDRITSVCGDSAYGSLNRNQPKGPEASLVSQEFKQSSAPGGKKSKFCHECGNKYPVSSAKFCVECGVKRLML